MGECILMNDKDLEEILEMTAHSLLNLALITKDLQDKQKEMEIEIETLRKMQDGDFYII